MASGAPETFSVVHRIARRLFTRLLHPLHESFFGSCFETEQSLLFQELPEHLARMALFKVNTGTREQQVCQLRWSCEVKVPELDSSVSVIPGVRVKDGDDRLVVLNRVARSVIESQRGIHPDYVFAYARRESND